MYVQAGRLTIVAHTNWLGDALRCFRLSYTQLLLLIVLHIFLSFARAAAFAELVVEAVHFQELLLLVLLLHVPWWCCCS
jgi:hypothetical protein